MSLFFTVGGTEYEFDQNKLALVEAIAVKKAAGLTVKAFQEGLTEMDPESLQAMVWLAKKRAGEAVRLQDVDFDVVDLCQTMRYEAPEGESDPPSGQPTPTGSDNGMTPSGVAPNTSEPSPTI